MKRPRLSALMKSDERDHAPRPAIMVVDDDGAIRQALELALGSQYDVVLCESAEQGLAALSRNITAIILDIKMMGRDGFWFCEQLTGDYRFIPIIFHSGHHGNLHMRTIVNNYHPFGYLRKGQDNHLLGKLLSLAVDFSRYVERGQPA